MTIYFGDGTNQTTAGVTEGGKIVQVKEGTKTSAGSYSTGGSWVNIGLSESITPSSSSNKVLILWYIGKISCNDWSGATRLLRGGTVIGMGDASGSRARIGTSFPRAHDDNHWGGTAMMWLDSPSTTVSTEYKIQVNGHSSGTVYINRGHGDGNSSDVYAGRSASTLVCMEVS